MSKQQYSLTEYADVALARVPAHNEKARQTRTRIKAFCQFLGSDPAIETIDQKLVDRWLADLKRRGISDDTIRNYRSRVVFVWNHAYENGRNNNAPPSRWRPPKEVKPADKPVQSELLRASRKPVKRNAKPTFTLMEYTDRYIHGRDISPDYAQKLRYCVRKFCDWKGGDPGMGNLDPPMVNEFLAHLKEIEKKPDTVAGYRRALLAIWNQAYEDGDNDNPPARVRKIKTNREPIEAYSHVEITKLLAAAVAMPGYFPNGVQRSAFWQAAILAAYSSGLRRGDLLGLLLSRIDQHGTAVVVQHKTGYRVCVRFNREALELFCAMHKDGDDRALPWPYHANAFSRQFRALRKAAGVKRGQFRWIRRSAASYAERAQPGAGSKLLGHRNSTVFNAHYNDELISVSKPIEPPPIQKRPRPTQAATA